MSEDAGYAERFLSDLLAAVTKPISDLRLLTSGLYPLPFALSLAGALLFALSFPVEAQQPAKIPQIGLVVANPEKVSAIFSKDCASSVISRGKTSGLSIATLNET
jgi:hypothetical protein